MGALAHAATRPQGAFTFSGFCLCFLSFSRQGWGEPHIPCVCPGVSYPGLLLGNVLAGDWGCGPAGGDGRELCEEPVEEGSVQRPRLALLSCGRARLRAVRRQSSCNKMMPLD